MKEEDVYHHVQNIRHACSTNASEDYEYWTLEEWQQKRERRLELWGYMIILSATCGLLYVKSVNANIDIENTYLLTTSRVQGKFLMQITLVEIDGDWTEALDKVKLEQEIEAICAAPIDPFDLWTFDRFLEASLTDILSSHKIEKEGVTIIGFAPPQAVGQKPKSPQEIPPEYEGPIFGDQRRIQTAEGDTKMETKDIWGQKVPDFATLDIEDMRDADLLGKRLLWTVVSGDANDIPLLLKQGADVNYRGEKTGATALHLAASISSKTVLDILFETPKVAYLVKDHEGRLPSMIAFDNPDMTAYGEMLLEREVAEATINNLRYETFLNPER